MKRYVCVYPHGDQWAVMTMTFPQMLRYDLTHFGLGVMLYNARRLLWW